MKKILLKACIALTLLSVSYSCSDDFLEVQPTQFLTSDQIAEAAENNPEIVKGSLTGVYTLMFESFTGGTTGHYDFGQKGYDIFSDMVSGDMALSVNTYGWYDGVAELQITQDYTFNENYIIWRYYYRIIRSANIVIDALGGNDATPENQENKHLMGQAKAMRAYAYFYLAQFFSTEYNPSELILPVYTDIDSPNQPMSSAEEVYGLIVSDLTSAIDYLSDFDRSQKNEVNQDVAKGLLAYTYAAMGDNASLQEAKALCEDIINGGAYTLMSEAEVLESGFNNAATPGWMWGVDLTLDNGLDLVSWWGQMDVFTYSYAWAGDAKAIDEDLYAAIAEDDVRKNQFHPDSGYYYLMPINKFYNNARQIGGQRNITDDYVYMRIAEIILLHAEVSARTGDEGAARNSLRSLVEQRVPDATYVDGLNGQALADEIYLQTRIELWGEGKTYLALKRNKRSTKRGANHLTNVGITIPYNDDRLTFEIPQSEIQNNPFISGEN